MILDVRSLYTNIHHKEGIEAVKQKLTNSKPDISVILTHVLSYFTFFKTYFDN